MLGGFAEIIFITIFKELDRKQNLILVKSMSFDFRIVKHYAMKV